MFCIRIDYRLPRERSDMDASAVAEFGARKDLIHGHFLPNRASFPTHFSE